MQEIDIKLPGAFDPQSVEPIVEEIGAGEGLHLTVKGALGKYPGCTHWHFKNGKETGILEVTWWPSRKKDTPSRLWLSVHGNRGADWITRLVPKFKPLMEARLVDADKSSAS